MKKINIAIIIFSVITILFLSSFIGLTISKNYAENHYEVTYSKVDENWFGSTITHHMRGCGKEECKYCNGKTVNVSLTDTPKEYSNKFVYYRTIKTFEIASLVLMLTLFVFLILSVLLKYKTQIKTLFHKEWYFEIFTLGGLHKPIIFYLLGGLNCFYLFG